MLRLVILLLASGKCLYLFIMKLWNNHVENKMQCYNSSFIWCFDGYPSAGCVTLCSHVYREYHLITEDKKWNEAQSYCRKTYTDLATIDSLDDTKRLVNMTAASGVRRQIWIGLTKTGVASWMWSASEIPTSPRLAQYTNWASLPDSSHHCGGMRVDGKWHSALCKTKLPFVCQSGKQDGFVFDNQDQSPQFHPIRNKLICLMFSCMAPSWWDVG